MRVRELLAARGYDALTTNRIAEAAGINIATLYRYYPNKQSILVAMSQRDIRAWLEAATAGVDSIRLGGDWRFEMGQLIAFAAQRRNNQPGGKAMRLAMRLLPELQPFAREEAFVTSSLLANILVSQWELDLAHAQQISRIAYEIANSVLDLSLVFAEVIHRAFKKLRHHSLHGIPIHSDKLLKEPYWQHLLSVIFLIHNYLRKDAVGYIFVGFCINNLKINILARQFSEEIERDIFGRMGIIKPPICVLFNDDWPITVSAGCTCHSWSFPEYSVTTSTNL